MGCIWEGDSMQQWKVLLNSTNWVQTYLSEVWASCSIADVTTRSSSSSSSSSDDVSLSSKKYQQCAIINDLLIETQKDMQHVPGWSLIRLSSTPSISRPDWLTMRNCSMSRCSVELTFSWCSFALSSLFSASFCDAVIPLSMARVTKCSSKYFASSKLLHFSTIVCGSSSNA